MFNEHDINSTQIKKLSVDITHVFVKKSEINIRKKNITVEMFSRRAVINLHLKKPNK